MSAAAAPQRYRTIVADPPWEIGGYPSHVGGRLSLGRGGHAEKPLPYSSMSLAAIRDVPVADMADADCRLFMWAISRYLPDSFGVLEAWGFRYRQTLVWFKSENGTPFAASIAPNHAEFLLVAVRGKPVRLGTLRSSVFAVPSRCGGGGRRHSTKPDVFLDEIERVSPGPRLELFARRQRLGWDTWGDEALNHVEMPATRAGEACAPESAGG